MTEAELALDDNGKFLGMRIYFVDRDWKFNSVLLGVRYFNPLYGQRDAGIAGRFKMWIEMLLRDFDLSKANFYGATTDRGSDLRGIGAART